MLAVNIPADGLFLAVLNHAEGDFSAKNCERIIRSYIGRYLEAKPDVILLNVCYRRSLVPSEVLDSYLYDIETDDKGFAVRRQGESVKTLSPTTEGVSKYFMSFFTCARRLLQDGIDIYRFAMDRIRETDCRVFFSVRMNDAHYTKNPAINASFALKNGCEHTIGKDGEYLDFSKEAVQNHYYSYIEELLENYAVDGIELDWLRYPTVLPPEKRAEHQILGGYMKKIRRLADRYSADMKIAVRLLPTERENLDLGFDAAAWIAEGSADILTIENFYIPTNFELPIAQWRESIEKRNEGQRPYRLLCGSDWGVSCMPRYSMAITPAMVRGFADACLSNGADGVYLFNFFEETDTSAWELVKEENGAAHLENCFVERMKAAHESEEVPRRYVHIGNSNQRYPISLGCQASYTFAKRVASPFRLCRCVIGCDTDARLSVYVNGRLQGEPKKEVAPAGFEYIPETEIGKGHDFIYAVSQVAPFVYSVRLDTEGGEMEIRIENAHGDEVKLLWLEIECE